MRGEVEGNSLHNSSSAMPLQSWHTLAAVTREALSANCKISRRISSTARGLSDSSDYVSSEH